jgi:hypothetical protein
VKQGSSRSLDSHNQTFLWPRLPNDLVVMWSKVSQTTLLVPAYLRLLLQAPLGCSVPGDFWEIVPQLSSPCELKVSGARFLLLLLVRIPGDLHVLLLKALKVSV